LTYSTHIKIKPIKPFNFELSTRIFSDGDEKIRSHKKGKYRQLLRTTDNLILITITSSGTVDKPELSVDLDSDKTISDEDRELVRKTVITIFNLDFDLKPFYEEVKNDAVMEKLIKKLKGLNSPTTATVFEALVSSIIEQQISLKAAHSIEHRMIKTFGDQLKVENQTYYAFPTPQKLASLTKDQLRECGLSFRKAEYIVDLSNQIVEGKLDLERLKDYQDVNEIIPELSKIRGVGVWTGELTILRGMHRLEAFPADDIGLRRAVSHYYCNDKRISAEKAREIAAKWGKWKGLAGFYLIVAEITSIE
jgi:DNA-3-methyladenine glycosylase II